MTENVMFHLPDEDTGESKMDVVEVPEGFSFQMRDVLMPKGDFVWVIASKGAVRELCVFLMDRCR